MVSLLLFSKVLVTSKATRLWVLTFAFLVSSLGLQVFFTGGVLALSFSNSGSLYTQKYWWEAGQKWLYTYPTGYDGSWTYSDRGYLGMTHTIAYSPPAGYLGNDFFSNFKRNFDSDEVGWNPPDEYVQGVSRMGGASGTEQWDILSYGSADEWRPNSIATTTNGYCWGIDRYTSYSDLKYWNGISVQTVSSKPNNWYYWDTTWMVSQGTDVFLQYRDTSGNWTIASYSAGGSWNTQGSYATTQKKYPHRYGNFFYVTISDTEIQRTTDFNTWTTLGEPNNGGVISSLGWHEDTLWAAVSVPPPGFIDPKDFGTLGVYRWAGGTSWTDRGIPREYSFVGDMVEYQGSLYVVVNYNRDYGASGMLSRGYVYRYSDTGKPKYDPVWTYEGAPTLSSLRITGMAVNDDGTKMVITCKPGPEGYHYVKSPSSVWAPYIQTLDPTDLCSGNATLEGYVAAINGSTVDTVGFMWGSESGVYTDNWTQVVSYASPTYFDYTITGLSLGNTYYYKAIGKNAMGWSQGEEVPFVAGCDPPTVVTHDAWDYLPDQLLVGSTDPNSSGTYTRKVALGKFTAEYTGEVDTIYVRYTTGSFSLTTKVALYASDGIGGGPYTLLAVNNTGQTTGPGINAVSISTCNITQGQDYWLGHWGSSTSTTLLRVGALDTGTGYQGTVALSSWSFSDNIDVSSGYDNYTRAFPLAGYGTRAGLTTSVVLNGEITDVGDHFYCTIRGFEWGTSTGVYTDNWTESGTFSIGEYNKYQTTGFSEEGTYYYRALAYNTKDWAYGSEKTFTIGDPFSRPTDLTITGATCTTISLSWTKGVGSTKTWIVYKEGDYPEIRLDGTIGYFGTEEECTVTGLDKATYYYFRAWAWKDG